MPFLLYGVTELADVAPHLSSAVQGAKVETIEVGGLRLFYSFSSMLSGNAVRDAALEFHRVVQAIFGAADVIPFRFPTLMANEAELASEIQQHAAEYHGWLARVRGQVQMEIRIQHSDSEVDVISGARATYSGAEYLRSRQSRQMELQAAATALEGAARGLTQGWRQRGSSDHVRCFALVARGSVAEFRQALANAHIASNLTARVSGPWPPTEFFGGNRS